MALEVSADFFLRAEAVEQYEEDVRSVGATSHYFKTWGDLHRAWFEYDVWDIEEPSMLPLGPIKIAAVGCQLKGTGYRSGYNYISAAKDRHIGDGHPWDEALT